MTPIERKKEGEMRAALYRRWPLRPGGIARWKAQRERTRQAALTRRELYLMETDTERTEGN